MKKQTNKKSGGSLLSQMTKIKLPTSVWWIKALDEILFLVNIKQSEAEACGCLNLTGEIQYAFNESTRKSADVATTSWTNTYEMAGKDCFETLQDAIDEVMRRKLLDEKKSFKYLHENRRDTQADKIRLLSMPEHREIVRAELIDQMKIEEGSEESIAWNRNTYRLALEDRGWSRMFPQIVDLKFPTLADTKDDDEEDF